MLILGGIPRGHSVNFFFGFSVEACFVFAFGVLVPTPSASTGPLPAAFSLGTTVLYTSTVGTQRTLNPRGTYRVNDGVGFVFPDNTIFVDASLDALFAIRVAILLSNGQTGTRGAMSVTFR